MPFPLVFLVALRLTALPTFWFMYLQASQAVYSVKEVGLSFDKVNISGGAIALGACLSPCLQPRSESDQVVAFSHRSPPWCYWGKAGRYRSWNRQEDGRQDLRHIDVCRKRHGESFILDLNSNLPLPMTPH